MPDQGELSRLQEKWGRDGYRSKVSSLSERNRFSETDTGEKMLQRSVEAVRQELVRWIEEWDEKSRPPRAHRLLKILPSALVAERITRSIVDSIAARQSYTGTAARIGQALELEVSLQQSRENAPELFDRLVAPKHERESKANIRNRLLNVMRVKNLLPAKWSQRERVRVGMVGIEMVRIATGFIEIETEYTAPKKTLKYVTGTQELLDWISEDYEKESAKHPFFMPMVEPPRDWTTIYDGGYPEFTGRRMVDGVTVPDDYELSEGEAPEAFLAVNNHQATPWRVNHRVLAVVEQLWQEGSTLGGLPAPDKLPMLPRGGDWLARSRENNRRKRLNAINFSRKLRLLKDLRVARMLKDETIYYPAKLDFRGRLYTMPWILSTQGSDIEKGLLEFAEAKPVTPEGLRWLRIHGANLFGLGANSLDYRERWAETWEYTRKVAEDPLVHAQWAEASDPIRFLAWCFDYAGVLEGKPSRCAVAMDGTANGFQMYALLVRNPDLAALVNCSGTERTDLYAEILVSLKHRLMAGAREVDMGWLTLPIDRKFIKKLVMGVAYGSTKYRIRRVAEMWLEEQDNPFDGRVTGPCAWLAKVLWEIIEEKLGSAREVMRWFRTAANASLRAGKEPSWDSPSGFPVEQRYREYESFRVRTAIGEKLSVRAMVREPTTVMDKARHRSSMAPNFIHSIDAAVMMRVVNACAAEGIRVSAIHDSFATHPSDAPRLAEVIREEVVRIFSQDLLDGLPKRPAYGDLNVREVLDNPYFFS